MALGFRCVGRVCEALREQDTEHLLQAWQEACQQRRRAEALEIDRLLASVEVFAHACEATLAARALQPVSGR